METIITFNKPYEFEGQTYNELDLSKIEDLTASDLDHIDKNFVAVGGHDPLKEMSIGYAILVAVKVTDKPIEFFKSLPAKEAIKLKTVITDFFYN